MAKRLFFSQLGWPDISIDLVSDAVKLFALINEDLVVPSNHMYSQNGETFFRSNPEVLTLNIIKPALDSQYDDFQAYFEKREAKANRPLNEYGRFLDELNVETTSYSDTQPAKFFTDFAIEQFSDHNSVLCQSARLSPEIAASFISKLLDAGGNEKGYIYYGPFMKLASDTFSGLQMDAVKSFAELTRLVAGAHSKQCSNLLPQENLVDWCLANPESPQDFILSDEIIFWEVFLESVTKVSEGIFSIEDIKSLEKGALSNLSFKEIAEIKQQVLSRSFSTRYEKILSGINGISGVTKNRSDLLNFHELIELKSNIKVEFDAMLSEEAKIYKQVEVAESLMNVAYQLFGGTLSTIESVISFLSLVTGRRRDWEKYQKWQNRRMEIAQSYARNKLLGQPVLIEYIDMLACKTSNS